MKEHRVNKKGEIENNNISEKKEEASNVSEQWDKGCT